MGRKQRTKKPKPQRKRKKIKSVRRKPRAKRAPTPEELIVKEARSSPGAQEIEAILQREGGLFVPVDMEPEGASSLSRQQSNVHQHLKKLDDEYGKWAAGEWAMSARDRRRSSSRPQTPVVPFGDYMEEQEAADAATAAWEKYLNETASTTFKNKDDLPLDLFKSEGGKRKSRRRRKKSRRRRKTKRKSRRRRK